MPADSEKAMFHAGSRFSRRWANYGAMFRPEPKALGMRTIQPVATFIACNMRRQAGRRSGLVPA